VVSFYILGGEMETLLMIGGRMAPIVYTTEGKRISERLWEETMAEFEFVKAKEIIRGVGK